MYQNASTSETGCRRRYIVRKVILGMGLSHGHVRNIAGKKIIFACCVMLSAHH